MVTVVYPCLTPAPWFCTQADNLLTRQNTRPTALAEFWYNPINTPPSPLLTLIRASCWAHQIYFLGIFTSRLCAKQTHAEHKWREGEEKGEGGRKLLGCLLLWVVSKLARMGHRSCSPGSGGQARVQCAFSDIFCEWNNEYTYSLTVYTLPLPGTALWNF